MRLLHFTAALTISMSGSAWAQRSPDVDNRVPELRVIELSQSGNSLKVTVQNVSTRTIRRVSAVLGKHKVDQDWSALAGGGVMPNATASLTISMAGLPTGSRHHPAAPPQLELSSAVFADTGQVVEQVPKPTLTEIIEQPRPAPPPSSLVKAKPAPISVKASARVEPKPGTPKAEVAPPAVAATPPPRAQTAPPAVAATPPPHVQTAPPAVAATPPPRAQTAPPASDLAAPPAAKAPRERATPPPSEPVQQDRHPPAPTVALTPRPTGHTGTREQGVQDELSRLLSLIEPYEADLASPYPRTALRKMIAAVVAEQNAWAASQPAVTSFDQGQRSAVETFVYGLQAIHERRDLDDDTLRAQVQRFLKHRRQSLNR